MIAGKSAKVIPIRSGANGIGLQPDSEHAKLGEWHENRTQVAQRVASASLSHRLYWGRTLVFCLTLVGISLLLGRLL